MTEIIMFCTFTAYPEMADKYKDCKMEKKVTKSGVIYFKKLN